MTMNTSVKSTALEPGKGAPWHAKLTSNYGMVILTVVLFAIFAALRPSTFASLLNFQLLTSGKSVLLILALAVTIPMIAGKIDLSIGYGVGLWQVMALSWQTRGHRLPPRHPDVPDRGRHHRPPERAAGRARPGRCVHRDARHRSGDLRDHATGTPGAAR